MQRKNHVFGISFRLLNGESTSQYADVISSPALTSLEAWTSAWSPTCKRQAFGLQEWLTNEARTHNPTP